MTGKKGYWEVRLVHSLKQNKDKVVCVNLHDIVKKEGSLKSALNVCEFYWIFENMQYNVCIHVVELLCVYGGCVNYKNPYAVTCQLHILIFWWTVDWHVVWFGSCCVYIGVWAKWLVLRCVCHPLKCVFFVN